MNKMELKPSMAVHYWMEDQTSSIRIYPGKKQLKAFGLFNDGMILLLVLETPSSEKKWG